MPKSKENMYATDTLMDERELVLRLIDGDEDAFCELYAAYKNRLLYFAMKFVKSREFAEDIFQDAFTVVWQSRRFINPDASFSSYLYTIVRNRILNQIRDMANEDKLKEHILLQSPNQKIPDRKTKCVIKTHINIKQNVIFGAKLKPV